MATTLAIRFPLGRYHATAWDRSVNEGAVEWPPSPWRLLRALISVWYERWPHLPARDLDDLLAALDTPPAYRTPPARPGHTRHYLPDTNHARNTTGNTALTLDAYLSVPRDQDLLVQWPADLTNDQRAVLGKLAELLPYLGRADTTCQARLLDDNPPIDDGWWRPAPPGTDNPAVRLLAPRPPIVRAALEITSTEVRHANRAQPPDTTWVPYLAPQEPRATPQQRIEPRTIEALRFAVTSRAPFRANNAVLLVDALHHRVAKRLPDDDPHAALVLGRRGATTDHQHAHWTPLPDRSGNVTSLVVWMPAKLTTTEVAEILRAATGPPLSGRGFRDNGIRGFPETRLLLQAAGDITTVAPELCGPARRWRSLTPYLPVRHRVRKETFDAFITADVTRELGYRPWRKTTPFTVARAERGEAPTDSWARGYRRYRIQEHMGKARAGMRLHLEFDEPTYGPLLLGQLSHFGFGVFTPEPEAS